MRNQNPWSVMEKENLTWRRRDGTFLEGIRAIKTEKGFRVVREDLDFREGDTLERPLPNGRIEEYVITKVEFQSGLQNLSGSFSLYSRRKDLPESMAEPKSVTYNLHGHNSRVNIHSSDHSHNIVGLSADDVFSGIEAAVSEAVDNQQRKHEILTALQALKVEEGKPGFIKRYAEFMGVLADIITVVTPFLPALA